MIAATDEYAGIWDTATGQLIKKLPIPDEATLKQIQGQIRELYESDFSKASTPEEKLALASTFLDGGIKTNLTQPFAMSSFD